MTVTGRDSLNTRRTLNVGGASFDYFSLREAAAQLGDISRLPFSLKVLLENLLRYEDGRSVKVEDIQALVDWTKEKRADREIAYRPSRVLMQDFTGVPAVVDLAAMRDAMKEMGGNPQRINPLSAVDLVIDHSVMVDNFAGPAAFGDNVAREFERNGERYSFLRWGQNAFDNFRVVPPGTGICHQVNLEYLAQVVWSEADQDGKMVAYPDTLVGTDSHTTMVNGMAVLGWGVGGIEAEAAILGQPVSMLIPEVVGFELSGRMREGTTATDLVLMVVEMLRGRGVVGKFVEFFGDGVARLSLADRATIANMAPEYGATCGFFPIDGETCRYLRLTGRDEERVALVEAYAKEQGLWREDGAPPPVFTDTMALKLDDVEPSLAGPKRPQDRVRLSQVPASYASAEKTLGGGGRRVAVTGADYELADGAVVIAAITSCTNTSNPSVMIAAGLVARKAAAKGLTVKPWVKTSLAPGSQVVTDYLERAGLQTELDGLGFNLVGYGCTTCIGNSGPLPEPVSTAITANNLVACSVLSGNRNFEGRVHPLVRANYLASPPLVVAYALAGSMHVDVKNAALGTDADGAPVYLSDIWPSNQEIREIVDQAVTPEMFRTRYGNVFEGPPEWQAIGGSVGETYDWQESSTYIRHPSFFDGMAATPEPVVDIVDARPLAVLGDSVTTDHISPAGSIAEAGPAGDYLTSHQVRVRDFNSYGSRRGNHEVMMRGTFANIRIRNLIAPGTEGGVTVHQPSGDAMAIYDAAMRYQDEGVPLVVFGGTEYGTGSSRDWAAKGTRLLGVKAVIAASYERIHRSNLIGMGVLPLQFEEGTDAGSLAIDGTELVSISGLADDLAPRKTVPCTIVRADGSKVEIGLLCRIDTEDEIAYYENGGILQYVLRNMAKDAA